MSTGNPTLLGVRQRYDRFVGKIERKETVPALEDLPKFTPQHTVNEWSMSLETYIETRMSRR